MIAPPIFWNLDDTSPPIDGIESIDLRDLGPHLRYHATRRAIEDFWLRVRDRLPPLVIYGSGDFHHLTAVLLRRTNAPLHVISFDNHPDWDVRPPRWACGGWANRALELPHVRGVDVWGCGNFELRFPSRLFAPRRPLRDGRLRVHAWAERQPRAVARRFDCMTRDDWRDRFENRLRELSGSGVYVTIDLDCLTAAEAVTNWENGLFTAADIAWAIDRLRQTARLLAADLCGFRSPPRHTRRFQHLASAWDHPHLSDVPDAAAINRRSAATLTSVLTRAVT